MFSMRKSEHLYCLHTALNMVVCHSLAALTVQSTAMLLTERKVFTCRRTGGWLLLICIFKRAVWERDCLYTANGRFFVCNINDLKKVTFDFQRRLSVAFVHGSCFIPTVLVNICFILEINVTSSSGYRADSNADVWPGWRPAKQTLYRRFYSVECLK